MKPSRTLCIAALSSALALLGATVGCEEEAPIVPQPPEQPPEQPTQQQQQQQPPVVPEQPQPLPEQEQQPEDPLPMPDSQF